MLVKGLHEQMEGREAKREEGRGEGKEGESQRKARRIRSIPPGAIS